MSLSVEYVSTHLFVAGFWGFLTSDNYFHCFCKQCPYSLLMSVEIVSGRRVAVSLRSVVVPVHFHEQTSSSKSELKKMVMKQLRFISQKPMDPQSITLRQTHAFWNRCARRFSKDFRNYLIDIEAVKLYALEHPEKSAQQINQDCGLSLNPRSICNILLREKNRRGLTTNLRQMIERNTHHLLGNDGEDILVFGQLSSIHFLSTTPLIQADGTFTCVVKPFTQLYVFHGLLNNGVSFPLLYCLVRGKTQAIYTRLLQLVETIAHQNGKTIFHRPVRIMSDFELSFINAARQFQPHVKISCCFFHFVANIKKRARPIIDELKRRTGRNPEIALLAEKTKRAFMMLPLLPPDLISEDVVELIVWRWRQASNTFGWAFDYLKRHVVENYVSQNARFQKRDWCVSGCVTRTNNSAESSHARLNATVRVSGAVTLDMFLFSIQKQMDNTSREIRNGCPSHSKSIYKKRNHLLAAELSDLLNGRQGVLKFLDHCSEVLFIHCLRDVDSFSRGMAHESVGPLDLSWVSLNR